MARAKLPKFSSLLKSRDVEDPVNLWVHRPLAYGIVAGLYRTPITPNQVTLFATLVGIAAGICWLVGSPTLVVLGGILLWSSAILDGADGILARAKQMQSEIGRALDGSADMIVAIATVLPAFWYIWNKHHEPLHLGLMLIALPTAVAQIYLYDFYKECFLNSTNPDWDGRTTGLPVVKAKLEEHKAVGSPLLTLFAYHSYVAMLTFQSFTRSLTNPRAGRDGVRFPVSEETTRLYRKHNYWPMQLWSFVSLCPHTYLMAICAIFDRLDLYLWYRVVGGNAIFVTALVWQRIATERTLQELEAIDARPEPLEVSELSAPSH